MATIITKTGQYQSSVDPRTNKAISDTTSIDLTNFTGSTPYAPSPILPTGTPKPIPVDGLMNPQIPAVTPAPNINTANSSNVAFNENINQTTQKTQAQMDAEAAQAKLTGSNDDFIKSILAAGEIGNITNEEYAKQGVDEKRKELLEYTGLLDAEKVALDDQIQTIQARGGTFGGSKERDMAAAQAKSSIKQNSILLKATLANNLYSSAKEIADRDVTAKMDVLKAQVDARKFMVENNRYLFDKADEAKVREEERALDLKEKELGQVSDLRLKLAENGAPLSVLNALGSATSLVEALKVPGLTNYFTSPADKLDLELKRAQINSTNRANQPDGYGTSTTPTSTSYTLKSGDDPYNIAQNSGISVDQLKAVNPGIQNWNNIKPGVTLKIPTAGNASVAVSTILASGKFTKDQAAAITSAINSGQDPATVIKNQAKNIMGQTEATKLTGYEVAKSQIQDLQTLLNQFYANGGNTSYLNGSYEKAINNLGRVSDPNLVGIATNISAALQQYRNAVSGTAYSVQEGKDIASVFPGINKSQGLNQAIIDGRLKAFDSTIDATYRSALGSAYDTVTRTGNNAVNGYVGTALGAADSINTQMANPFNQFVTGLGL